MSIIVHFKIQLWYERKKNPLSNLSKKSKNFRRKNWTCAFFTLAYLNKKN